MASNYLPRNYLGRAERTVPMRVLVLGFFRTGTASMRGALETLGYKHTHHMDDVLRNPVEVDMWTEAIEAKFFGKGQPYGRADWDRVLGHCQAVTGVPAILFSEDLIAAYPEAKVILTIRDPTEWWTSYNDLQGIWCSKRTRLAARLSPTHFGKGFTFIKRSVSLFLGSLVPEAQEEESKKRFVAHYDHVRRLLPQDRLLEYEVGEGWQTLCAFLEEPVPQGDFPRINDTEGSRKMVNSRAGRIFVRTGLQIAFLVLLICLGIIFFV
ncbi:P-loop containing nucleoside triphosphate hydrolase protein [Mycena alexandri]|uniref:P-loop containing nucleoside triphosphate hydrolase protein n=1 Tax=Mycena alexandri TaxID=1745969 RepID=A0AAD6SSG8_9AGAR|nr:P-loop containing nucleoside triphosphate hydrolase protein [Mycena alexandri]KAJ7034805.1 P-loop containing nucleoside triphosphate hydrolase protein [Mycena alexandri]